MHLNKKNTKEKLYVGGYFSQPSIFENKVAFVSENDLWEVSLAGGKAHRLTNTVSEIQSPSFSPTGN